MRWTRATSERRSQRTTMANMIVQFQQEQQGRQGDRIRAHLVEFMVVVQAAGFSADRGAISGDGRRPQTDKIRPGRNRSINRTR